MYPLNFSKKMRLCNIPNCGNPVWSNGLCRNHIPRKSLKFSKGLQTRKKDEREDSINKMRLFFLSIWNKREHHSEVSGAYLGNEPLTIYFHHILPKNRYPEAMYDGENIVLLTLDEHTDVESDMYKFELINKQRIYLQTKYNL